VLSARGFAVCECVNGPRELMPQARVVFLEGKRVKTHTTQVWINTVRRKDAGAIGFGERRGPAWPLGTHHVNGGVWNTLVFAVLAAPASSVAHVGN
jgi:hypothetical protein